MEITFELPVVPRREARLNWLEEKLSLAPVPGIQVPGSLDNSYNSQAIPPSPNKPATTALGEWDAPGKGGEKEKGKVGGKEEGGEEEKVGEGEIKGVEAEKRPRRIGKFFPYYN